MLWFFGYTVNSYSCLTHVFIVKFAIFAWAWCVQKLAKIFLFSLAHLKCVSLQNCLAYENVFISKQSDKFKNKFTLTYVKQDGSEI